MTIELYKNSLISKEDASLYFEERYDSRKWFELTEENQEKLLISASRKINRFDFVGEKADESQPMTRVSRWNFLEITICRRISRMLFARKRFLWLSAQAVFMKKT